MAMITLKDGGVLIITEDIESKWKNLYPKADYSHVLTVLSESGIFDKCSKQKALKVINKRLKEENKKNDL